MTGRANVFNFKFESGCSRRKKGEEREKKQPRQSPPYLFPALLFQINHNGRLVVLINDNKDDVEDEPEVHLLDADADLVVIHSV